MRALRTSVLAALLLSVPLLASAGTYSITPSADPGGLQVGDTLMFTVSVDFVRPPNGYVWSQLVISNVHLHNTNNGDMMNFTGCADLTGVGTVAPAGCETATALTWSYNTLDTRAFLGGLLRFKGVFDAPGTYELYIENIVEEFFDPIYYDYITNNPPEPATPANPITFLVTQPVPVAETTWGEIKSLFR